MRNCFLKRRNQLFGLLCLTTLCLTGCGETSRREVVQESTAQVEGVVTLDNRPLNSGLLHFYSMGTGSSHQTPLQGKGAFSFTDPIPPGEYHVFITGTDGGILRSIPEKYQSETSTDYTTQVQTGANQLTIDLKK